MAIAAKLRCDALIENATMIALGLDAAFRSWRFPHLTVGNIELAFPGVTYRRRRVWASFVPLRRTKVTRTGMRLTRAPV